MTRERIEQKINSLESAIETVALQIQSLGMYRSTLQVTAWRKHRASLSKQLKEYKSKLKTLPIPKSL